MVLVGEKGQKLASFLFHNPRKQRGTPFFFNFYGDKSSYNPTYIITYARTIIVATK